MKDGKAVIPIKINKLDELYMKHDYLKLDYNKVDVSMFEYDKIAFQRFKKSNNVKFYIVGFNTS